MDLGDEHLFGLLVLIFERLFLLDAACFLRLRDEGSRCLCNFFSHSFNMALLV